MYGKTKTSFFMDQTQFNSMQNNFKRFLGRKLHPSPRRVLPPEPPRLPTQQITQMERTHGFGKDDCEIGYKISFTDKNGKQQTRIVAIPPTMPS